MLRWLTEQGAVLANAVLLLTRLPVPAASFEARRMGRSVLYFPLVGALVGGLAAAVLLVAAQIWTGALPAVLAVAVAVGVTGALHEDGLADTFDALGAGADPEARRATLKDSRLGTYGGLALLLTVLAKVTALAAMAPVEAAVALVAAHVLGRWAAVALLVWLPYLSGATGSGAALLDGLGWGRLTATSLLALALAAAVLGWAALPAALVALAVSLAVAAHHRRTLGGVTGDGLGAACQLVEVAIYLLLAPLSPPWTALPGLVP